MFFLPGFVLGLWDLFHLEDVSEGGHFELVTRILVLGRSLLLILRKALTSSRRILLQYTEFVQQIFAHWVHARSATPQEGDGVR
jgi:hypothetical protein